MKQITSKDYNRLFNLVWHHNLEIPCFVYLPRFSDERDIKVKEIASVRFNPRQEEISFMDKHIEIRSYGARFSLVDKFNCEAHIDSNPDDSAETAYKSVFIKRCIDLNLQWFDTVKGE